MHMLSDFYQHDGGREVYNAVLAARGCKQLGSGNNTLRILNPFYADTKPDLKIYCSSGTWRHKDFGNEEYTGNCIDFAALHFGLDPSDKALHDRIANELFNGEVVQRGRSKRQGEALPPRPQQTKFYQWQAGAAVNGALDEFMQAHGANWAEVRDAYGVHMRGDKVAFQVACPELKVRCTQLTKYRIAGGKLTKKSATTGKAQTHRCPTEKGHIDWVLFGAHLITEDTKRVCIVEAQDTALLCAMKYPAPSTVWAASVGINLKQQRKFMLQHRTITWRFYPDVDAVEQWREECEYLQLHGLQCELMRWHTAVDWSGADHLGIDTTKADLKDWLTLESMKG
jgi:hypothetical protein